MRRTETRISRSEAFALLGLALGAGTLVDGLLLSTVGTAALVPTLAPGPDTWAIAGSGALVAALALGALRHRLRPVLSAVTPRLYPYASGPVNAAIFLVLLVSAVAVYAGFFEMFVGAHDNGDFGSAGNQTSLSILIDVATGLLWLATAYAVLLIHRMVSIGRYLESPPGTTDAYGGPAEPSSLPAPPAPQWTDPPPPDAVARRTRFAVALGLSFLIAVGIQVTEVGLAPAAPVDWLAGQVLLPAMPVAVTFGCEGIERGVRELERRFARRWPAVPPGAAATANPA